MPCDTIQLNRVDVGKLDKTLHAQTDAALAKMGYTVRVIGEVRIYTDQKTREEFRLYQGVLTSQAPTEAIENFRNKLKQQYSTRAMFAAAQRNGWRVRQTGPNQYEVQR